MSDPADKKMPATILALLFGWLGAHKFYLGYTKEGCIQIALNLLCLGGILGLVEGLIYLTKSDAEFVETYVTGRKGWL